MAILEVRKPNDPILRKKSKEVLEIDGQILRIIDDLKETLKRNNGVGVAAPQVGISKRVIVIDLTFAKQGVFELVNPRIIKKSRIKESDEEGCLNFPGVFLTIKRAKEVLVKAKDRSGKEVEIRASDIFARVLQHEIDHLDGILFFDRLPLLKKLKFKISLNKKQ